MAVLVPTAPASALAIYAHPDDPEVSCGGTLARWAEAGTNVEVCVVAAGDKGSLDPSVDPVQLSAQRRREVAAAGRVLGVAGHHFLGYPDGELHDDEELRARLVGLFRLDFRDPAEMIEKVRGEPVYLLAAMTPDEKLRLKPQNLVTGLPVRHQEAVN